MNYAQPYATGKDSIMAIIKDFTYSEVCTHRVPQSYSLDLTSSDYYLVGSLKKKSLLVYYYSHDKAL
jgi:hypothetical protein